MLINKYQAAACLGLIVICFLGCSFAPTNLESVASGSNRQTSAYVSAAQKAKAFEIIKKMQAMNNYIPFDYSSDGCYARALYMAMELAAEGIPSSSVYLEAREGKLNPQPGVYWDYHVAPLLIEKDSTDEEAQIVLDPSLFDEPVKLSDWKNGCHPQGQTQVYIGPGSKLGNYFDKEESPDLIVNNFDELPPFSSGHINYCQRHLCYYLNEQGQQCDYLKQRTKYLIKELIAKNKYYEDPFAPAIGRAL